MIEKVIYIGGVARSGSSWLGQIFNSSPNVRFRFQPLFSFEFRGRINEDSSAEEYQSFFKDLFIAETEFLTQKDKVEKGIYPDFQKEEEKILVLKENRFQSIIEPMLRRSLNLSFVGIIRNPCATLYSWTQNAKEFSPEADIMKEWRFANCKNKGNEDYFGYYKWKEVANLYLDLEMKYKERVQIIYYDQFVKNVDDEVKVLFQKLGIPFADQTNNFLSQSKKGVDTNYYSVFKGTNDKLVWKSKLPSHIIDEVEADLKNTRLEKFLY